MASLFPNGAIVSIGTSYSAAKTITAISNADPGVATAATHGFSDNDILVISSAWPRLDQAIVRVANSDTGTFALEGVDTTDTTLYPTGGGAGTAREVMTWVPLSQITNSTMSGGEQQFFSWQYLEDGVQRQRPTFKNARSMEFTMDFDASLAWHDALLTADRAGTPHALRVALPSGGTIYYNVYVGFDGEPTLDINQNMQVTASFAFANPRSQRYS